jgi:Txe/YoeB family toxin of Txe-Axe toxin-antitoxin module
MILKWTNRMIEEAARGPAPGIGTPERLSHSLSG